MYYLDGGQKIILGTDSCKVLAVDLDGSIPQILFTPDETIIGSCEDDGYPVQGLFEESLVPVGRTIKEMIFSSPTAEAWFNILKWLPTQLVLEFGLVCREWRAMIMVDQFIHSHFVHANLNKSPRIMFIMDPRFGSYLDLEKFSDQFGPNLFSNLVCSQPCHGLNAGSCAFWGFICNPAIGYCEHIAFDDNDGTFFAGRMGLGYNSDINKHIAVLITYKEKNLKTKYYELQCKMRHVNDDIWHPVQPPRRPVATTPPAYANGKIYWLVDPNLVLVSASCEIVAFNVRTLEFEIHQGPTCSHDSGRMSIQQLQDTVCVACSNRSMNTVDIWMLKDFGIWFMEYHIELEEFLPDYLSE